MALLEINRNPPERELRQFAGIWFPAFFLVIGLIAGYKFGLWSIVLPVWAVVAVVAFVGIVRPKLVRPIYLGWMYAAYPIGWTVSHVVLGITWYLVITPIGLIMRMTGRDPMHRRIDKQAASYWIERGEAPPRSRYFRQF